MHIGAVSVFPGLCQCSDVKRPGSRSLTNAASLWYVLMDESTGASVPLPQLEVPQGGQEAAEFEEGRTLREKVCEPALFPIGPLHVLVVVCMRHA